MNLGIILRVAGTILCGVAFVLVIAGGAAHLALICGFGGATAIGAGTLIP